MGVKNKLAIICCLHGDEKYGLEVCKKLPACIPCFIGNEEAIKQEKRYLEVDLNRCFPGNPEGKFEERVACKLLEKIKDFDFIIDLHSCNSFSEVFGIITKPNEEKIEFAKKLGIKFLVIMPEFIAKGCSLIDFAKCGISLETGPHKNPEIVEKAYEKISNFLEEKNYQENIQIYEVFEIIKKKGEKTLIKNLEEVRKGEIIEYGEKESQIAEYDFIPVLVDSYNGVLCFASKPIDNIYKQKETSDIMAKEEFKVTAYEVTGNIDYDKLIKEFGVSKIDKKLLERIKKHTGEPHFLLRRGIFFAHRDMNWLLDEYEKGNKFFLYTGRAPSGPIHLGHLMPWIFTKWLQDKFNVELWFQFPDEEKYLFKQDADYEEIQKWMYENMLDIIALGFDPKKTHFIVDTKNANILYPEAIKVAKKITFSTIKATFGFNESTNIGSIFYTSMQAVPSFLPSVLAKKEIPCLIPHAIDQDPHFRITRDILPKLGHYKPASIQCSFLPPLQGTEGKMSSSAESEAILTTDNPEEVKRKINKYAFSGGQATVEEHRKKGGNPDMDVSFQYLRMFFEPDDKKLKKIEDDYRSGKLLTGELKAILIEKINAFLKEHQKKRELAKKEVEKFLIK